MKNDLSKKIQLYGNIIVPSGLSLTLSAALAAVTFFVYHWHIFLNYFEVNGKLKSGNYVSSHLDRLLSFAFGANGINNAVLIIFWAAIGLIIYVIGRLLIKDLGELSSEVSHRNKFLWPKNAHPNLLEQFFERFLFRIAILAILVIYCAHVLSFYFRGRTLSLPIFSSSVITWLQAHSVVNQAIFVVSEIIAFHVVVILLRLLFMRSRLFVR